LPPGSTGVASTPTTGTNTNYNNAAITAQNNGQMLLPTAPEIAIASSVLGAAALLGWYVWRRKQGSPSAVGYPLAQTPQVNIASPYAQTTQMNGNMGMVQEHGLRYQQGSINQGMVSETPHSQQTPINTTDTSLEAIMRQAQIGLFALPNKEEYS
jgi:hypothetical protein